MRGKLLAMIPFWLLTLCFASCTEKSIAGRVYSGIYDDSVATISFDKNGCSLFEIADQLSVSLEYSSDNGSFSGICVSQPAMEFTGKYDDDALLWIWWGGHPVILDRADKGKRNKTTKKTSQSKSIVGKTYVGRRNDSPFLITISFKKFGLALSTYDDDSEYLFYTDDTEAQLVRFRYDYTDEDDEDVLTLHYDDDSLWGTHYGVEFTLEDLDRKIEASYAAKAVDDSYDEDVITPSGKSEQKKRKSTRELKPLEEKHTETYDTLLKYGFHTSEGTIHSDFIQISTSQYRALSGILAVFINDDGKSCFLDRKFLTSPDYVEKNTLTTPTHMNITGCIKEILYAKEGSTLRHAFVLIECKESDTRNILLQNMYGKNMFGDFIQGMVFTEVDKNSSLEEKSSDLIKAVKDSNDWYYTDSLKWFIESE